MKKHFYLLIAAVMALLFSFAACGGDDDVKVKGVSLNKAATSIAVNASETLTVTFEPENPKNKTVSWASSNTSVATVTDNGSVRGVAQGTSNITVTTEQGDFKATCVVTVFIPPPTGVALSKTSTELTAGLDERLTATVAPAGANQTVTWQSSNHAVASVFSEGNGDGSVTVIAVGAGTASVTAKASNGVESAPCVVTVRPNVIVAAGVIVSPPTINLMAAVSGLTPDSDTTVQLDAAIDPPNAPAGSIVWSASDPAKATVSSTGLVRTLAGATGNVEITASMPGAESGKCVVTITPVIRVTSITVTPSSQTIDAGQTAQLTAAVAPANAHYPSYTWSSSDDSIATVSGTGLVTARADGSVIIRATTRDGNHIGSCNLTINKVYASAVAISPRTAEVLPGASRQLAANFTPSFGGYDTINWTSSNTSRVTIIPDGAGRTATITGVSLGDSTITVTAVANGVTLPPATCVVSVVSQLSTPDIFIAGSYEFQLPLWGQITESGPSSAWLDPTIYDYGEALAIAVNQNGDLYIAGWDDHDSDPYWGDPQPVVWIGADHHHVALHHPHGFEDGSGYARGIAAWPNGDIIICGEYGWFYQTDEAPVVWRSPNYETSYQELPHDVGGGTAYAVAVAENGDWFVAGQDYDNDLGYYHAEVWKNGVKTELTPPGAFASRAFGIATSGNNVYIVGWEIGDGENYVHPCIWTSTNGGVSYTMQILPTENVTGIDAVCWAVAVSDSNVFVGGYEIYNGYLAATVWVNGVAYYPAGTVIQHVEEGYDTEVLGMTAFGGKGYAAGWDKEGHMIVWELGTDGTITPTLVPAPQDEYVDITEGHIRPEAITSKAR